MDNCPKMPWMVEFYSTVDGKVYNQQLRAASTRTYIDHLSKLHHESQPARHRATQIIFTIPENVDVPSIETMLDLGMNIARIKLTMTNEKCREIIGMLRETCDRFGLMKGRLYPLAIALECKGTDIRTGKLRPLRKDYAVRLEHNHEVFLTNDPSYENLVTPDVIYVDYQKINKIVKLGDKLLIDNGNIELSVTHIDNTNDLIKCIVEKEGELQSNVTVTLLNAPSKVGTFAEQHLKNINFAIDLEVDAIIMRNIPNEVNLRRLNEKLKKDGKKILIISKIENAPAVENFDHILRFSDCVYIASKELKGCMPPEKVFLVEKSLVAKCNKDGKPAICAVQLSEAGSLSEAEISRLASLISDGVDCLILSPPETRIKLFFESVRKLNDVCREAEAASHQRRIYNELSEKFVWSAEPIYALAMAAVQASFKCNAAAIVIVTRTGRGAKIVSRFRPKCPIIAIMKLEQNAKHLQFYRNVTPIVFVSKQKVDWHQDIKARYQLGINYGKSNGLIRIGDIVVVVYNSERNSVFTNAMQIVFASSLESPATVDFDDD